MARGGRNFIYTDEFIFCIIFGQDLQGVVVGKMASESGAKCIVSMIPDGAFALLSR